MQSNYVFSGSKFSISVADVCLAFTGAEVGTKVLNNHRFMQLVEQRLSELAKPEPQNFIVMPEAMDLILSGDVEMSVAREAGFVAREWRGWVQPFADGSRIPAGMLRARFCAVVVYTWAAYVGDPDVQRQIAEGSKITETDYVVVTVIGSRASGSALPPNTFVHNVAGGNNAFLLTGDDAHDAGLARKWVEMAKASENHSKEWIIVAR